MATRPISSGCSIMLSATYYPALWQDGDNQRAAKFLGAVSEACRGDRRALDRGRVRPRRAQHRQHQHHRRELRLRPLAVPADLRSGLHRRLFRRERALRLRPAARRAGVEPDAARRSACCRSASTPISKRRSTASGRRSSSEIWGAVLERLGTRSLGVEADSDARAGGVRLPLSKRRSPYEQFFFDWRGGDAERRVPCAARRRSTIVGTAFEPLRGLLDRAPGRGHRQSRPSLFRAADPADHADRRDGGAVGADRRARRLERPPSRRSTRSKRCGRPMRAMRNLRRARGSARRTGPAAARSPRPSATQSAISALPREHCRMGRGERDESIASGERGIAHQNVDRQALRLALELHRSGREPGEFGDRGARRVRRDDVEPHDLALALDPRGDIDACRRWPNSRSGFRAPYCPPAPRRWRARCRRQCP